MISRTKTLCLFVILCLPAVVGCQAARKPDRDQMLSRDAALEFAVALANEECMKRFSAEPFDEASYRIEFKNGRWQWGVLDPAGPGGFSAVVSFDVNGNSRIVEVFLSTDMF